MLVTHCDWRCYRNTNIGEQQISASMSHLREYEKHYNSVNAHKHTRIHSRPQTHRLRHALHWTPSQIRARQQLTNDKTQLLTYSL